MIILGPQRRPEGETALVPIIKLGYGVEVPLIPLETEVVPSTPFLLTRHRVMFVLMLLEVASTTISCTLGDLGVYGA